MNRLLILFAIGLGFAQCKQPAVVSDPAPFDYNKSAIKIMTELKPHIVGTWTLNQVVIKAHQYNYALYAAKLLADITIQLSCKRDKLQ